MVILPINDGNTVQTKARGRATTGRLQYWSMCTQWLWGWHFDATDKNDVTASVHMMAKSCMRRKETEHLVNDMILR